MLSALAKGVGLGAVAMYYLDPVLGRRRRSLLCDQMEATRHDVQDFVDRGWRDLTNRIEGFAAEGRAALSNRLIPDDVLVQRVRAMMGRYVSHPAAIEVRSDNGCVVLTGPILSDEVSDFVAAAKSIRGVQQVDNRLEVHRTQDTCELQGGIRINESRRRIIGNWSPARRLLASTAGLALMTDCILRRSPGALVSGTIGFGLLAGATAGQSGLRTFQTRPTRQPIQRERSPREAHPAGALVVTGTAGTSTGPGGSSAERQDSTTDPTSSASRLRDECL